MNEREQMIQALAVINTINIYNQAGEKPEQAGIKDKFLKHQVLPQLQHSLTDEDILKLIVEVNDSPVFQKVFTVIKNRIDLDKMKDILKNSKIANLDDLR